METPEQKAHRISVPPLLILVIATIAVLVPFAGKAFHIDDPLFIWVAKHIQTHPENPYDFKVNWYTTVMPMAEVTKNPPLACYFISLAARLVGWSEIAIHLVFLIPALGVILGTYYLARPLCKRPLIAALVTLLSPVFLVSSTNVMCDILMLAFWVWAVVFWIKGIEKDEPLSLVLATLLIGFCALIKYYGMCLIPMLALYTVIKKRKMGWWMGYFLIPAAILVWYQLMTQNLYGRGLLLDAGEYATAAHNILGEEIFPKTLIGLTFMGGCFLPVLVYTFSLWSKKVIAFGILLVGAVLLMLSLMGTIGNYSLRNDSGFKWLLLFQLSVLIVAGLSLIALVVRDLNSRRDAEAGLIFSWIAGTFCFAAWVNWTINGRSILPLVPAASILLMRKIESRQDGKKKGKVVQSKGSRSKKGKAVPLVGLRSLIWPLITTAVIALLVARADFQLANSARDAAMEIRKSYEHQQIFFQGHWGFQYYMESLGGKAFDWAHIHLARGDIVVIPENNTNTKLLPEYVASQDRVIELAPCPWLTTMSFFSGAGYYCLGPAPFAVDLVPPERYTIFRANSEF